MTAVCAICNDALTGNHCNRCYQRSYSASIEGKAVRKWSEINARCLNRSGKDPCYQNVRNRFSRDQFINWYMQAYQNFIYQYPRDKPSLDRIDPNGDYAPGNCRIISAAENSRRVRRKMAKHRTLREGKPWHEMPAAKTPKYLGIPKGANKRWFEEHPGAGDASKDAGIVPGSQGRRSDVYW